MAIEKLEGFGYKQGSILFRFSGREVYRAERLSDGEAVAIETLGVEYPDRAQVARLKREAKLAQKLSSVKGVRRVYETLPYGSGNLALVSELFESSIRSQLNRSPGQGLPTHKVLDIARQLVSILDGVHSQGIIHKALSAEHVLYNPKTNKIALTGFGIASEIDQERQAVELSRQLEGPLPYMSPEQTGRMNRDLDYRSDYYSLGVLIYEMLTGQQPFRGRDLLEWVHSHISQQPRPPHEILSDIPEILSSVVLKLMSKSPEARYQSTEGLLQDLEICSQMLEENRSTASFQPGSGDVTQKFLIPQKLYGRDTEVQQLLKLFESAARGSTEFCLVHGYSGVGKSALVNELDQPLVREQGFLVQGKFEQFQQGEPYSALITAYRSLVHQVLALPDQQFSHWQNELNSALQPNAQLVIELVPELELIIGQQSQVAELPPAEEKNRLQIVLGSFLRAFCSYEHPVVLFLDDLQWSDVPTLDLLRRLMTSKRLSHLLVIGAFRSNETGENHPLRILLNDLGAQKNISQISIGPLEKEAISELVNDCMRSDSADLSELVYEKAQGNPFFTGELLRQLYKEGAIYSEDGNNTGWSYNLNAVRWSELSDDVVEFMIANLRQLTDETQQVLQLAACIGGTFDLESLATVYEKSHAETAHALLPALKQNTIVPLHTDYRLVNSSEDSLPILLSYKFQHDRVQQAAHALIDPEHLTEVHLLIGRLMLQHSKNTQDEEQLIGIVGHMNLGRALISSSEERLLLAELNLNAGIRAKRSSAYETALNYLETSQDLLPKSPWEDEAELMQQLAIETQQCAYLTGDTEKAEHWIGILLEHAENDLARANILATQTRQYATLGRMEESIKAAIEGLAILGIDFSPDPSLEEIATERQRVLENLNGRHIEDLVDAPVVQDDSALTAIRLLMEIFAAAFLSGSGNLFPYQVLKMTNLSLRHGNCPETAFSYAAYGMLLCGEFDEAALGYRYAKVGLAINEQFDDVALRARVIYVYAMFVHHWSNDWASLSPWFKKGIEAGYESGDLLYLAYSAQDRVIWNPSLDLETAHKLHAENLEIVRQCAYQDSLDSGTLFLQLQANMLGKTKDEYSLSDDKFDEELCLEGMRKRQFMTGIANYHIYKAEICLLYGEYEGALAHVREQDKLIKSAMSLPQLVRFYIVAFLTLCFHYPKMDKAQQGKTYKRLEQDLAQMRRWAENCEDNFRHLQYLMEAELLCLKPSETPVLEQYDKAIEAARLSGFLRDEAMASERAARYLLIDNQRRSAEGYLRAAHSLYNRWGALRKVSQLETEFPVLRELASTSRNSEQNLGLDELRGTDVDMASVMKASRTIAGEIVLKQLLKTTMNILLESTGAQWGCLVIRSNHETTIGAVVLPSEGFQPSDLPSRCLIPTDDHGKIPVPASLISHVLHRGETVVLHNAAEEGDFIQDPYMQSLKPVSCICVPLIRGRFEGAIYMENNLVSGVFNEDRAELIKLLAAQASVAIENAQLYEEVQEYSRNLEEKVAERTNQLERLNNELQHQVDRDGLTGVANRRRADQYLEELWGELKETDQPLSIILLDVDHFKLYNDTYGHQEGDDCLKAVAAEIEKQLGRTGDLAARFGGEEFLLILPHTNDQGAITIAEKVRQSVENMAIEHQKSSASSVVTISAGISSTIPQSSQSINQLIRAADVALYNAKRAGRNQTNFSNINAVTADILVEEKVLN